MFPFQLLARADSVPTETSCMSQPYTSKLSLSDDWIPDPARRSRPGPARPPPPPSAAGSCCPPDSGFRKRAKMELEAGGDGLEELEPPRQSLLEVVQDKLADKGLSGHGPGSIPARVVLVCANGERVTSKDMVAGFWEELLTFVRDALGRGLHSFTFQVNLSCV